LLLLCQSNGSFSVCVDGLKKKNFRRFVKENFAEFPEHRENFQLPDKGRRARERFKTQKTQTFLEKSGQLSEFFRHP
jgi:hypothetical protein